MQPDDEQNEAAPISEAHLNLGRLLQQAALSAGAARIAPSEVTHVAPLYLRQAQAIAGNTEIHASLVDAIDQARRAE